MPYTFGPSLVVSVMAMMSGRLAFLVVAVIAGAAAPAAPPLLASEFPARVLAAHNDERVRIGATQLVWDTALADGAALHAARLAATGDFNHSDRASRPGVGENLWRGTRGAYPVEAMVGAWLGERRDFLPGIFPNNSRTGNWMAVSHYTQIIWPMTTRIGCALASNRSTDYLVCRYSPKGNVEGRSVGTPSPRPI